MRHLLSMHSIASLRTRWDNMKTHADGHEGRPNRDNPEKKGNHFASEDAFWLTMGLATGSARQALTGADLPDMQALAAERFTDHIRPGVSNPEAIQAARQDTMANLEAIKKWLDGQEQFNLPAAFAINEAFTAYWVLSKLIEMEWQKGLGHEDMAELYEFLDGTLAARREIEGIAKAYAQGRPLSDDERLLARTHWSSGHNFFIRMRHDIRLLAHGYLEFQGI